MWCSSIFQFERSRTCSCVHKPGWKLTLWQGADRLNIYCPQVDASYTTLNLNKKEKGPSVCVCVGGSSCFMSSNSTFLILLFQRWCVSWFKTSVIQIIFQPIQDTGMLLIPVPWLCSILLTKLNATSLNFYQVQKSE